ncbi:DNA/RNA non-specific endonuclease [Bacillus sp. CMF12]|uniref:T7SS effector LXG polymorphic toxin n=1 Tax=Bacillus sp. CMF12 TaxID=2884834 RepID=UPI0022092ED5|nr:T7SS effector LXG polymorphic toxin [Bacillus sp. CMF12]USK52404.1 DNA/RNA non-specific endonuclease [Bacillus sp. CMF12]
MSNGRRRFILKVLDARELHSGLKELHSSLHSLEEQIRNIARDVEGITSLEDSFRGEGAAAIQAFFRECHSPFLLFFEGFLADYQNTLKRIASSLQMLEPASNGFIRQSFLDGEAAQGLVKTESITISLTEETNAVMQKVSDIVSLPHLQDGEFSAHVRRAELHRRNTVDDLITFDGEKTLALDPIEQDLHLMQTFIDEISSLFQSGNLSISDYSVKQLHSSPIYGELLEGIRHKAGNSMRTPEFHKELGITALGQILPPGAYSIWAIWQSTYERKTIQYQLRALKALAKLNDKEISPEEFTSLSGREILTVEVIDEHGIGSQNQGGKFHLYDDGRIVREYYAEKGKAYEFVDSIPEDRVGGVRELDSMADGTPLEILEYLSLAAVVRKQGTKVIRKSINKADFDALVRILKEEKGHVVLPGKKDGKGIDVKVNSEAIDDIIRDGSHIFKGGKLKPNIKYQAGEYDYLYKTDESGRLTEFNADDLKLTERDNRLPHKSNTPGKEPGDHAGHLAADRFGGSPDLDNLVSQSSSVNLSKYKKFENQWAKAIEEGKDVSVNVKINYEGNSLRPSSFDIEYEIDGRIRFISIEN